MTKIYHLRFLLEGQRDDLIVEVRKADFDRLRSVLNSQELGQNDAQFFWFDSVIGRSYAVNLSVMQAVRFLWDQSLAASDSLRDEGLIQILFRGREEPITVSTESPEQIYDLFTDLEHGPDVVAFPGFEDEDGELFQLNRFQIAFVSAPTHLLAEGRKQIDEDD